MAIDQGSLHQQHGILATIDELPGNLLSGLFTAHVIKIRTIKLVSLANIWFATSANMPDIIAHRSPNLGQSSCA
ncbi:MAG TPA: hypothetical protein VEK06_00690 [Myxococcota bacterium]|nr:hypothetical protein [Myxococcota bacterium]